MARDKGLQADPEDRVMTADETGGKAGLLARLLGPFARRKAKDGAVNGAGEAPAMEAPADEGASSADMMAAPEDGAEAAMMEEGEEAPPRGKLGRILHILGLVLWPSFLRGDFSVLSRRLLIACWSIFLLGFAGLLIWLAATSETLTFLPGSEVKVGVAKLTLPPEAKLAPEQKAGEQAKPADARLLPSGLLVAPDPALAETTPFGQAPKIGADGRQPWRAYARPFDQPADRPRIALVLTNMGLDEPLTAKAADALSPDITFAFNPYAPNLATQIEYARMRGHEALLLMPLEPFDYPNSDPGPHALLTTLNETENQRRLDWVLARASGYIGFINFMGGKFTSSPEHMKLLSTVLKQRGLIFVDARTAPKSVGARAQKEVGGVFAFSNRQIDVTPNAPLIEARLEELERVARGGGVALGTATPLPITLDRLIQWSRALPQRSMVLAPVSAIANRQNPE